MSEQLTFDLTLREVDIVVGSHKYVLREASENVAREYQNSVAECSRFAESGEFSGVTGPLADTRSQLVALCLFDVANHAVSLPVVRGWPARIITALFKKALTISELKGENTLEELEEELEEIKDKIAKLKENSLGNVVEAMTGGSD